MPPVARPYLAALTSLRFFAALYVVVYHLWRWDAWSVAAPLARVVAAGPVAVTFFFVLSGFVLTWTYEDEGALRGTARAFWRARLARVYPLHLLALVVSVPVVLALWRRAGADPAGLVDVAVGGGLSLLLVQAFHPGYALAWNPPAWSLSVEALFYALFPSAMPRLAGARRSWATLLVLWGLSLSFSVGYLALSPDGLVVVDHRTHAPFYEALKYHPLVRLPELLFGVVLARLYAQGLRLPLTAGLAALTVVIVVSASGLLPYALVHNGLFLPLFGVLLVSFASCGGVLSWRPLQRLGEASYALYVLHVPVFYWVAGIGERRTGHKVLDEPPVAVATVLLCVALSLVAHRFVEVPLRRRLRGARSTAV